MNLIIFLYCCLGGNFKWLRIIELSSTEENLSSFLKHQEDKLMSTGRTSSRVHEKDFLQSPWGGFPPESTGSSYRVCSFGGQVHTVCCAWPGTFSVTITFTAWWTHSAQPQRISGIQMKWENFRKERAQSSLLFMQITLPTFRVNSPHIHSSIRQRITKCQ